MAPAGAQCGELAAGGESGSRSDQKTEMENEVGWRPGLAGTGSSGGDSADLGAGAPGEANAANAARGGQATEEACSVGTGLGGSGGMMDEAVLELTIDNAEGNAGGASDMVGEGRHGSMDDAITMDAVEPPEAGSTCTERALERWGREGRLYEWHVLCVLIAGVLTFNAVQFVSHGHCLRGLVRMCACRKAFARIPDKRGAAKKEVHIIPT